MCAAVAATSFATPDARRDSRSSVPRVTQVGQGKQAVFEVDVVRDRINLNLGPLIGRIDLRHALANGNCAATLLAYFERRQLLDQFAVLIIELVRHNYVIRANLQHLAAPDDRRVRSIRDGRWVVGARK